MLSSIYSHSEWLLLSVVDHILSANGQEVYLEMDSTTARQILGVDAGVDEDTIEQAYREKVQSEHPDQSDQPDPEARDRFRNIQTAREVLLDELENGQQSSESTSSSSVSSTNSRQQTSESRGATDPRETASDGGAARQSTTGYGRSRETNYGSPSGSTSTEQSQAEEDFGPTTASSSRGHSRGRWTLTKEDKFIFGLSTVTVLFTLVAMFAAPFLPGELTLVGGLIWAGLGSFIGYRLSVDGVPRRGWVLETPFGQLGISPTEGFFIPAAGFGCAFLLALPVWIGLGFVAGFPDQVAQAATGSNFGLADWYSEAVDIGDVIGGLVLFYAPLVGWYSVGVAVVTDG